MSEENAPEWHHDHAKSIDEEAQSADGENHAHGDFRRRVNGSPKENGHACHEK